MGKRKGILMVVILIIFTSAIIGYACFSKNGEKEKQEDEQKGSNIQVIQTMGGKTDDKPASESENVTVGSEEYRRFILDNVLHSQSEGDIHYNVYIPDSYDGTKEYALYITLPGYQGCIFKG